MSYNTSNNDEIVQAALSYRDKNMDKYNRYFEKATHYKLIPTDKDMERSRIIFYDINKTKLFESRFEIAGVYHKLSQTWIWPWAVSRFDKNHVVTAKKILNYGLDIPPSDKLDMIKHELITSRLVYDDPIQLDVQLSLVSYLSKTPIIFKLHQVPKISAEKYPEDVFWDYDYVREIEKDDVDSDQEATTYYLFIKDVKNVVNSYKSTSG